MGTKTEPGKFDCYANAQPDEPLFVLLARDRSAAALVNLWAAMRRLDPESNGEKIVEAERCANDMIEWMGANYPQREPEGINTLAAALCVFAEAVGAVITITQQPLKPLAMGNYVHALAVREKRTAAIDALNGLMKQLGA